MTRQKIAVVVGVPLVAVVLVAGGFMMGNGHIFGKKLQNQKTTSSGKPSNNVVPLGQNQSGAESSSGLTVNSGGASDLGQLGANGQGGDGGASGGGSSSSELNPATFKDYEKYKDQAHALFGEIIKGTGTELAINKKAAVYYKGWLTNGQMFDQSQTNSNGQRQPLIYTLGAHEVVPGLEEGTLGMKVGGKRLVIIPSAVGYGAKGYGPVPADALMVFEIELVTVQ